MLDSGNGCGTQASPTLQNMLSNLFDAEVGALRANIGARLSGQVTLINIHGVRHLIPVTYRSSPSIRITAFGSVVLER